MEQVAKREDYRWGAYSGHLGWAYSFHRDLKLKLQRFSQGSKGMEEYYKVMEILIIQAKIKEDPEVTMARFLNGLNHDIKDVVKLQEFVLMEDLLHKVI